MPGAGTAAATHPVRPPEQRQLRPRPQGSERQGTDGTGAASCGSHAAPQIGCSRESASLGPLRDAKGYSKSSLCSAQRRRHRWTNRPFLLVQPQAAPGKSQEISDFPAHPAVASREEKKLKLAIFHHVRAVKPPRDNAADSRKCYFCHQQKE